MSRLTKTVGHFEVKRCKNCKKRFKAYVKNKGGRSHKLSNEYLRPSNAVTCSSKCAKEYARRNDQGKGKVKSVFDFIFPLEIPKILIPKTKEKNKKEIKMIELKRTKKKKENLISKKSFQHWFYPWHQ
jgi:hypothetical protein